MGIEGYQLMEGLDALVGNCTVRPMMAIEGDWLINHEYKRTQFTLMGGDQLRRSEKEAAKRVEKAEAEEKKQAEKGKGKGKKGGKIIKESKREGEGGKVSLLTICIPPSPSRFRRSIIFLQS